MTTLKPVYLGGRLRGYRDENGFPVSLREGDSRGGIPLASAPMVYQDIAGNVRLAGGSTEALEALAAPFLPKETPDETMTSIESEKPPPKRVGWPKGKKRGTKKPK